MLLDSQTAARPEPTQNVLYAKSRHDAVTALPTISVIAYMRYAGKRLGTQGKAVVEVGLQKRQGIATTPITKTNQITWRWRFRCSWHDFLFCGYL